MLKNNVNLTQTPTTVDEWHTMLGENLTRLYHFGIGLNLHEQRLPHNNQSVLFSAIVAHSEISKLQGANELEDDLNNSQTRITRMCLMFVLKFFRDLLSMPTAKAQLQIKSIPMGIFINDNQLKSNEKDNSDNNDSNTLGDVFDICLMNENFRLFFILVKYYIMYYKNEDVNIVLASKKLELLSRDKTILVVKSAIRENVAQVIPYVLDLLKQKLIETEEEKVKDHTAEKMQGTSPNQATFEQILDCAVFETMTPSLVTIREILKNMESWHSSNKQRVSQLIDYYEKHVSLLEKNIDDHARDEMLQENYELNGGNPIKTVITLNNMQQYHKSLTKVRLLMISQNQINLKGLKRQTTMYVLDIVLFVSFVLNFAWLHKNPALVA